MELETEVELHIVNIAKTTSCEPENRDMNYSERSTGRRV